MMQDFLFRSAMIETTPDGPDAVDASRSSPAGEKLRLERAKTDMKGTARRPLRLRFVGRVETTIEMSRSEAYAFSEWLDAAVTRVARKTPSQSQEIKE